MIKTKKVIILGVNGNCIDILDTINEINAQMQTPRYECIGFLDDDIAHWNKSIYGVKVLGVLENAKNFGDAYFVNGIGNEKNYLHKETIIGKTNIPLERFLSLSHPSASVSKMAKIGFGTMILQNVTIASNVRIGNHIMILPNSVISHDVTIGDYTCITGGVCVSGGVTVGKSCYFGTNSSIIDNISIGEHSLIGMGSVVLKDVPSSSVFVGNPAKFLRRINE